MRKLGTIDLEVLNLAIKENGTFNENHLENSQLKRHGVGKILDTLASLKDRKFILLNKNGSFSITELAREILWSESIPVWARILRLLQIKSCNLEQIKNIMQISEEEINIEIMKLRKNQLVLMSPQRQEDKLVKIYEILPEGINEIDKTETDGFNKIKFGNSIHNIEILETIDELEKQIEKLQISNIEKEDIKNKINNLKDKLKI
jgi:transcription initiation factor IIE alpha subunit